jgi:multidrug resistance efflux pump
MKPGELTPIPVPSTQRLRLFRANALPWIVFLGCIGALALLWNGRLGAGTMIGQAEGAVASISSHKPGVVAGLAVGRFQKVRAGQTVASVMVADPRLIEASLAVVRSDLELLRLEHSQSGIQQKRFSVDHAQLRIDWMRQRAELASAKVNLQFAASELRRNEDLFRDKVVSASAVELARANHGALEAQVEELTRLVSESSEAIAVLKPAADLDAATTAAMVASDSRLKLAEAELETVPLRAPFDGTITAVHFHNGESVTPGIPVLTLAADTPTRIVGYMRQPLGLEPKAGDTVIIRTRDSKRASATARVNSVAAQFDALPLSLQSSFRLTGAELALAVDIALPETLVLRPGEMVDLVISR